MANMPEHDNHPDHPPTALTVGLRRTSEHMENPHALEEDELRAHLQEDPNDQAAFLALVDLVLDNATHLQDPGDDPLNAHTAEDSEKQRRHAVLWALAEEFAGHPRGWYPLIELARLSLATNEGEGLRRLNAGISRDDTGQALARSIDMLRESHKAQEAYALGSGHWRARDHHPVAGVAVIRAALDCGKVTEAERHLEEMLEYSSAAQIGELDPNLLHDVQEAVRTHDGG